MAFINKDIVINAPVEQIYLVLNDIQQYPFWYTGIDELKPEPGFPTQVGTAATYIYRVVGMNMIGTLTIVKDIPFKERHISVDGMIAGLHKWKLTSKGDATYVQLQGEYEISKELLKKRSDRQFIERLNDKYAEESLAMMKTRVEA